MTRQDIDVLWQQALQTAVRNNEIFTRYEFANLVLEEAAKVCDTKADEFNRLYSRESDGADCCMNAIRSMKT